MALQRRDVLGGAVALVPGEAVHGILGVQLDHVAVPGDLGDDGGRPDHVAEGVAVHQGPGGTGQAQALHRVRAGAGPPPRRPV